MFEISWSEIFIVAVVAIIFVGPKELPAMLRTFGRMLGQLRRTAGEFQRTFNEALKEAERQANVDKMRKDLDAVRNVDPTRDLRKGFADIGKTFSGKPTDPVPPAPPAASAGAPPVAGAEAAPAAGAEVPAAAGAEVPPAAGAARLAAGNPAANGAPPVAAASPAAPPGSAPMAHMAAAAAAAATAAAAPVPPPAPPAPAPVDHSEKLERVAGDR